MEVARGLAGKGPTRAVRRHEALWWFDFHQVAQVPEQLVGGGQGTYLSWVFTNLVLPPNQIAPTAVIKYVRTFCHPSVVHGGSELYPRDPHRHR
jgi:hypothetical protein